MRITIATSVLALLVVSSISGGSSPFAEAAKRPSRSSGGAAPRRSGGRSRGGSSGRKNGPPPQSKARTSRRAYEDEYDDPADDDDDDDEDDLPLRFPGDDASDADDDSDAAYEDEYDERPPVPQSRRPSGKRGPPMAPPSRGRGGRRGGPPAPPPSRGSSGRGAPRYDDYDDEYDASEDELRPRGRRGGPPSRGGRPPSRGGRPSGGRGGRGPPRGRGSVVPYSRRQQQQPSAFTRGLAAIRDRVPDVETVKNAAVSSVTAARETTTKLSSNIYREVKGLTSSELEQVMLKATKPNDEPVKGKHVERLVGVTYQISGRYDIYDAVLRKLWNKMVERDWRTTIKSLYILHRFAADGAPDHQAALKARLRELRRTRDPKRKGDKYFNSKTLLPADTSAEVKPFANFLSRYAHYVLLRAQCFGGMFNEISQESAGPGPSSRSSRSSKAAAKPITATALRTEHLEAAQMILKAGCACALKDGEVTESTAMCVERVVSDLIGLTTATAVALNRALKGGKDSKGADPAIVKKWCQFYSEELLPQTKGLMKRTTPELDAYGMFLPSRMGASVSGELLQKGLQGGDEEEEAPIEEEKDAEAEEEKKEDTPADDKEEEANDEDDALEDEDDYDAYDEYSYDEYYDNEEA
mmetsp:Transcript_26263/g.75840  ORF Transcript_26263/g.75840 Transcript_26263/m.75840 type:complete len:640 (-) Transcript_26263:138-2057(-)